MAHYIIYSQEEWELVYNHLALYSSVLEEACTLTTSGLVIVSQTGLKKVWFAKIIYKIIPLF